jgi:hypothetical protein
VGFSQRYMALIGELTSECFRRSYQGFFYWWDVPVCVCVWGGGGGGEVGF